ncbi:hypothetical protein NE237_003210 [Protea cynaroides]|uniref:Uncharacterized protein n=1 Tax=Protea cynaroides TaxID=273540 RepID=A0A9Q0KGZ0_9MAGN|nr:hypothetical protein NE237_003210 [Protea cynaroides]
MGRRCSDGDDNSVQSIESNRSGSQQEGVGGSASMDIVPLLTELNASGLGSPQRLLSSKSQDQVPRAEVEGEDGTPSAAAMSSVSPQSQGRVAFVSHKELAFFDSAMQEFSTPFIPVHRGKTDRGMRKPSRLLQ